MADKYYLNEDKTYRQAKLMEWAEQFEKINRCVANDKIHGHRVSTVWLGLDHNYYRGKPLVFETMIFADEVRSSIIFLDRYSTWQEAEEGHKVAIEWLKAKIKSEEKI